MAHYRRRRTDETSKPARPHRGQLQAIASPHHGVKSIETLLGLLTPRIDAMIVLFTPQLCPTPGWTKVRPFHRSSLHERIIDFDRAALIQLQLQLNSIAYMLSSVAN